MKSNLLALAVSPLLLAIPSIDSSDRFLEALALTSDSAKSLATFGRPVNNIIVPRSRLNGAAVSHSEAWMNRVLAPGIMKAAAKSPWTGRQSADGVSKLFIRSWTSGLGSATWSDNGVLAVLRVRLASGTRLSDRQSAEGFAEERLKELLNLPELPASSIKWHLEQGPTQVRPRIFGGNVFRGLHTEPIKLPNGVSGEKVLDPVRWHNVIFAATDGTEMIIRINFFDTDPETLRRVSDFRKRF